MVEAVPSTATQLSKARDALAQTRFLDALAILERVPADDPAAAQAAALRKEAVDGQASAEREEAGAAFLTARTMAAGPERVAALHAVRDQLVDINLRWPDNSFAEQIRENVARVDAELASGAPAPAAPTASSPASPPPAAGAR